MRLDMGSDGGGRKARQRDLGEVNIPSRLSQVLPSTDRRPGAEARESAEM